MISLRLYNINWDISSKINCIVFLLRKVFPRTLTVCEFNFARPDIYRQDCNFLSAQKVKKFKYKNCFCLGENEFKNI